MKPKDGVETNEIFDNNLPPAISHPCGLAGGGGPPSPALTPGCGAALPPSRRPGPPGGPPPRPGGPPLRPLPRPRYENISVKLAENDDACYLP